ncbi:unnamed protein product [Phyllotreta striolata]|uniref:Translational activator of cytochrome c oxidase 1 n=1 Tax=Phyllotreta striolata TaxID=444603 RepID=A0A9N9XQU9_PHYSR|nr:unnamed protein product [Phyllotreta striolata]
MLMRFLVKTIRISNEIGNKNQLIIKRYAGHSKWSNIKHIKAAKDAEKARVFTRIGRQIRIAVSEGGSIDPSKNLQLSQIIEQSKRANMPAATIQNILKSCENDKSQHKKHILEIKGPGSCFIICEVFTNQLHLTKQTIATILRKNQAKYSDGGGIHLFEEKGTIDAENASLAGKEEAEILEQATDHAILSGAEDVQIAENNSLRFTCGKTNLNQVVGQLEKLGYKVTNAEVNYTPLKLQALQDAELEACQNLYEKLESVPEVTKLTDNIA